MARLREALKASAGRMDGRQGQPRFAIVASVNVEDHTARVTLQPEGVLTGWLPVLTAWTGAGWGMVSLPQPGDQVFLVPQEGDAAQGVIVGRSYSDRQPVPATPVGELWIVHKSGNSVRLKNDGTVCITGDLHVDGDIFDRKGSLDHLRQTYNSHHHIAANGTATGNPTPQD